MFNIIRCLFPCFFKTEYDSIKIKRYSKRFYAEGNRFIENNQL